MEERVSFTASGYGVFCTNWNPDGNSRPAFVAQKHFKKYCQKTYTDGQCSPQQSLPRCWNCIRLNPVRWRDIIFRPGSDLAVIEGFDFPPSCEGQEWLVVSVVDEDILQAIAVCVLKHGAQRSHSGRAIELGIRKLSRPVLRHLR